MSNLSRTACCAALVVCGLFSAARPLLADPPDANKKAELKPDVAALIQQSTDVYKKMKSYQHTAAYREVIKTQEENRNQEKKYLLALDRPNKFAYRLDAPEVTAAAVSDGKTFINYRQDDGMGQRIDQYIQKTAPDTYKGINIVDDVLFEPLGTYVIALMLQGDALADKDVRSALEQATVGPTMTEGGKKWKLITFPFGSNGFEKINLYINTETHLIDKAVTRAEGPGGSATVTETMENVKIDKPVDGAVFQFTPPASAKKVDKFGRPPRPDDARNDGTTRLRWALRRSAPALGVNAIGTPFTG